MKKSVLVLLAVALISFASVGQVTPTPSPYKNMLVNEKVHYQGDSTTSCYVVIQDVGVNSLKDLKAMYMIRVYKSKAIFEENVQYFIPTLEIPFGIMIQFTAEFTQGDLFNKISVELKTKLLALNPTWEAKNIIIEP